MPPSPDHPSHSSSDSLDLRQLLKTISGLKPSETPFAIDGPELERAIFRMLEEDASFYFADLERRSPAAFARLRSAFALAQIYHRYRLRVLRPVPSTAHAASAAAAVGPVAWDPDHLFSLVPYELRADTHEWFGFVPAYANGTFGAFHVLARGHRSAVAFDALELYARLVHLRPAGFFLFHNHPDGDPTPSETDLELTRTIQKTAKALGISFIGHGIVSSVAERWIVL